MKKKKYTFHPELKAFEKLDPPVIPALLPFFKKMLDTLYFFQRSDAKLSVEKIKIKARDGYQIRTLLYTPKQAIADGPCLIFYHGGGYAYQAAPHHFVMARRLAAMVNMKTLFVDYRLAPKYRFPTQTNDAFDAYKWVLENAKRLSVDPERIAVCGDSAGGNLATVVCLMAKDQGEQMPCGQVLIYPYVDRSKETESMRIFTDTPMCNSKAGQKYNELYYPEKLPEHIEYLSPVEAPSLKDMPPAYIETAEFDCLRDGGRLYAKCLREAGVEVELQETKAAMHGYDIATKSNLVKGLNEKRVSFLKRVMFGSGQRNL